MTRLRYNGVVGALGASLTNSATSVTFAAALTHSGGTNVPTLAGNDFIPLTILDTKGVPSEIVYLTAYTAGATSGTIVRGREGTSGVAHSNGDKIVHAPSVVDFDPAAPLQRVGGSSDDEFDGLSSVSWSDTPTAPTTWDINTTVRGKAYLRSNGNTNKFIGKLVAIPGAYPFTVITRVHSTRRGNTNLGMGFLLTVASPTGSSKVLWLGSTYNGAILGQRLLYNTFDTSSFASANDMSNAVKAHAGPIWLRMIATSATSFAFAQSLDGELWVTSESGLNPGFTPGLVGLGLSENGTADVEGVADFWRVT